nr:hypothetical protein [Tanacetum cinerariifolium]
MLASSHYQNISKQTTRVSSILVGIIPLSHSSPSYVRTAISIYGVSLGIPTGSDEFPLSEQLPTANKDKFPLLIQSDATAVKLALLVKSRNNYEEESFKIPVWNFKAEGSETLEQTFNRLSDLDTMSLYDLYHHIKVYESEVQKKSKSNSQNMAFISSAKHSSRNEEVYTASVSTASTNVSPASANIRAANDMEEIDIKWNMALLSIRADRFWKKTGKKITIQGLDVAGFDKSKVECFNFHKMGHFTRECRAPRSQDRGRRDNFRQRSKVEEQTPKALIAIDGVGWDWSFMGNEQEDHALVADEEVPTQFALMAKTSAKSEVFDNSLCSKNCKKNTESLNNKITDLDDKLFDSKNMLFHYKAGLTQVEDRLAKFKNQEIKFYEKIRGLELQVGFKNDRIESLTIELDLLKKEKGELETKLTCFQSASKNLDSLLESQRLDKNKEGLGYSVVPPPPTQVYSLPKKDMSWTGLLEFQDDTITDYNRPSPTIASNSDDVQNRNTYVTKTEPSPSTILPKTFIKFVKVTDRSTETRTGKVKTAKPTVKYDAMYSKPSKSSKGNSQNHIDDKGYWDSGCSRQGGCKITGKGTIKTGKLEFENVYFVKDLKCHVMILNTLDHLGKFEAKGDEGYFIGYSMSSKAFRLFNKRTKRVEENLDVDFLENKAIEKGAGPNWLFDIDSLTKSMNYVPVVVAGFMNRNSNPTATLTNPSADQLETLIVETPIPTVSSPVPTACLNDSLEPSSDIRRISKRVANQVKTPSLDNILTLTNRFEDILRVTTNSNESNRVEADVSNMETTIAASPTPTLIIHKDHPKGQIIGPEDTPIQTRHKSKELGRSYAGRASSIQILECLEFVDCAKGVRLIGTKWVLKNKKDKKGIVIRNKARLVAQAYASFMGFIVYQMDVNSAFLYGTINEEVYVMQPPGFQDPEFPAKVYKVEKAMGTIDQTLYIRRQRGDFILVQVYVDDIIFGSLNPQLCREFEAFMHEKFQMSAMGELNFFLGLQVLQKEDGIFLSQDKYVGDILKKFGYSDVRSSNTPMDKDNSWGKDRTGKRCRPSSL